MALYFTEDEVALLLPMAEALSAVEAAFRALAEGGAVNRPRARVKLPGAMLHVMPAGISALGALGVKTYTVTKSGARFFYLHFDAHSGELLALMAADRLGQIRTGAASGVATRYLAREDAATAGILGTGWQARSQLEAIAAVRSIRSALAYSRDPDRCARFSREMSEKLSIEVRPAGSAEEVVRSSEIVTTATSAREPVLRGEWLKPGQHVNAVGSNFPEKQEVDLEAVVRADVIAVDFKEQALIECGDLIAAAARGRLLWEEVHELADVVRGKARGRTRPDAITLFESQGMALEDVAVAQRVYEKGLALGLGKALPF